MTSASLTTFDDPIALPPFSAKLRHHGETRRIRLPRDATWADLSAAAATLFPKLAKDAASSLGIQGVTYVDEQGDSVDLSTTDELREALRTNEHLTPGRALTFHVAAKDDMSDSASVRSASSSSRVESWLSGAVLEPVDPSKLASQEGEHVEFPNAPDNGDNDADIDAMAVDYEVVREDAQAPVAPLSSEPPTEEAPIDVSPDVVPLPPSPELRATDVVLAPEAPIVPGSEQQDCLGHDQGAASSENRRSECRGRASSRTQCVSKSRPRRRVSARLTPAFVSCKVHQRSDCPHQRDGMDLDGQEASSEDADSGSEAADPLADLFSQVFGLSFPSGSMDAHNRAEEQRSSLCRARMQHEQQRRQRADEVQRQRYAAHVAAARNAAVVEMEQALREQARQHHLIALAASRERELQRERAVAARRVAEARAYRQRLLAEAAQAARVESLWQAEADLLASQRRRPTPIGRRDHELFLRSCGLAGAPRSVVLPASSPIVFW
jgi:hypothetical protein